MGMQISRSPTVSEEDLSDEREDKVVREFYPVLMVVVGLGDPSFRSFVVPKYALGSGELKPESKRGLVVDCQEPMNVWISGSSSGFSSLSYPERDLFQQKQHKRKEWSKNPHTNTNHGRKNAVVNQPRQSRESYQKRNGLRK